ncbi:helix-turn-helix domain-containing protein [Mucilaginibacter sp. HD30]
MAFTLSEFLRKDNESLVVKRSKIYHALNEFHTHPDMELLHITEGTGTLLIGETPISIKGDELILVGCNVPHLFRFEREGFTDPIMLRGPIQLPINLLMLHFDPLIFGETFINVPENGLIKQLLKKAGSGLLIEGAIKNEVIAIMNTLLTAPVNERLIQLLTLLNKLASQEHKPLTDDIYHMDFNRSDEARLTKIFLLTMHDFNKRIKLKTVAEAIYMAPNAFCNYFKQKTGKTYFEFLLEVRVNHACKLLRETDFAVVMICYDSGFTNLSNFNRHFKDITGKTPLAYRREYRTAV